MVGSGSLLSGLSPVTPCSVAPLPLSHRAIACHLDPASHHRELRGREIQRWGGQFETIPVYYHNLPAPSLSGHCLPLIGQSGHTRPLIGHCVPSLKCWCRQPDTLTRVTPNYYVNAPISVTSDHQPIRGPGGDHLTNKRPVSQAWHPRALTSVSGNVCFGL